MGTTPLFCIVQPLFNSLTSTSSLFTFIMPGNPGNVARGLKAAVSNQNNSEETRADAQRRLDEMIDSGEANSSEAHAGQVARGHKAAMSNNNNSEEAKQHSQQILGEMEESM